MRNPIPDDDVKYVYLYSENSPTAKRVNRYSPNGAPEKSDALLKLEREGWTTSRFAQMLYKDDHEPFTARSYAQVEEMCADGWSKTLPVKGANAHPHANDPHRVRMLTAQKKKVVNANV